MTLRSLLVTVALVLSACAGTQATGTPTPPTSTCANRAGGVSTAFMQLSAVRVAHQNGFDRVTFEFAPSSLGPSGMPPYQLTQQASAQFTKDPSGQTVRLAGSAGLKAVFRNSSGTGTYTGSTDLKPGLATIAEVSQLGDFERVLSWGVGLNTSACFRAVELTNPVRLALDFQN